MHQRDESRSQALSGLEFRRWAEFGTEAYGRTPWFFLRELAQNSRDAGAACIRVQAGCDAPGRGAESEWLTFEDDGRGMTAEHARRYLFRLYSSSKEGDRLAAGMYGVGFWTVLYFDPVEIRIESCRGRERWGMALGRELQTAPVAATLTAPGTRIRLTRQARFADGESYRSKVKEELQHYCRYLRRRSSRPIVLPIYFGEECLNEPMTLPGHISLEFRQGAIEGVVGVGERPRVTLLAKGLPIWEGHFLDELMHHPERGDDPQVGEGCYPVFLLNGNDLTVTLFRRDAVDDRALRRLVEGARSHLQRLVATYSRSSRSRSPFRWLRPAWSRALRHIFRPLYLLAFVFLAAFTLFLTWMVAGHLQGPKSSISLQFERVVQMGTVTQEKAEGRTFRLSYSPEEDRLFAVFYATLFDEKGGFFYRQEEAKRPARARDCSGKVISVRLFTAGEKEIFVPCPTGYRVDAYSLEGRRGEGKSMALPLLQEPNLRLPSAGDWLLTYRCCPEDSHELTANERQVLTRLPVSVQRRLTRFSLPSGDDGASVKERIDAAGLLCRQALRYDRSPGAARSYRQSQNREEWLSLVLRIGRGDCDVVNGLAVLALRKMGLPARLAVGFVGKAGRLEGGWHAWCEYFDSEWRSFDATPLLLPLTVPTPTPSVEGSPAPWPAGASPRGARPLPLILCLAASSLMLLLLWAVGRWILSRRERVRISGSPEENRQVLGRIAHSMLRQPRSWGWDGRLWNEPMLTTLRGQKLSLRDALDWARKGRLFLGSPNNRFCRQVRRGRVLDARDGVFSALYQMFPRLVDLDRVAELDLQRPEDRPGEPLSRLLVEVNRSLESLHLPLPVFLLAGRLQERAWLRVTLRSPRQPPRGRQPRRYDPQDFIAVNPKAEEMQALLALFLENPRLAIFNTVLLTLGEPGSFAGFSGEARLLHLLGGHLLLEWRPGGA